MVDKKSEAKDKSGVSVMVLSLCCVASVLLGLVGGVFGGSTIKAALGIEESEVQATIADQTGEALGGELNDPSSLFAPMPGVFDPDKDRFYADAGEFLVAIKYQGRTRYLQLTAQLVGHDEEFMSTPPDETAA